MSITYIVKIDYKSNSNFIVSLWKVNCSTNSIITEWGRKEWAEQAVYQKSHIGT